MTRALGGQMRGEPSRRVIAFALAMMASCFWSACSSELESGDGDGDGDVDGDVDGDGDADGDADEDSAGDCTPPCTDGQRCFLDTCIPDNGTCGEGEGVCQNDTACVDGVCVPHGTGPLGDFDATCTREPEPLDRFEPEIQCEWPGTFEIDHEDSIDVRMPPMVADLDGDQVPEIVFISWDRSTSSTPFVRAIRGDTCAPVWTSEHQPVMGETLALADLDGDGLIEVCGLRWDSVPFCLNSDGSLMWPEPEETLHYISLESDWLGEPEAALAIVDVEGDGTPEVVVGLSVFDGLTGTFLRGDIYRDGSYLNPLDINALADVDLDGNVEALTGSGVYDLVNTDDAVLWTTREGFTAVADLVGDDEVPEVVVVAGRGEGWVRVQALDGEILFQHEIPSDEGVGGPPTVADLDGDGQAELALASDIALTAFDLDCADVEHTSGSCPAGGRDTGIMWSRDSNEGSSGWTGSVVFDFEGDGPVEVVYADQCWARVYNGATGDVKFSAPHFSQTGNESPVVADVDGDFYTEIVVPHEYPREYVECPLEDPLNYEVDRDLEAVYRGITVYRDRNDRWAPSRPLWSQHTEHWSNRLDDGTVPVGEVPSWTTHNSYRQALPREGGTAIDTPDLTAGEMEAPECSHEAGRQPLRARVCNRGTLSVAPGVDVAFRLGTHEGETLCTATTAEILEPGGCETVECIWEDVPLNELHEVHVVVDPDDESGIAECHEDNNTATLEVRCPPTVG